MPAKKKKSGFEETAAALEEIVKTLESGELSLEEQIAAYESGVKLAAQLEKQLDDAEKRVRVLQENGVETVFMEEETV